MAATAEVDILRKYLRVALGHARPQDAQVADMSRAMSANIAHNRTLSDPNPDKEGRKRAIRRNQYCCQGSVPAHEVASKKRKI